MCALGRWGCQERLGLGSGREGRVAAFFGVGSGFSSGFGLGLGTAASPCPRGRRREGRGITERRRGALPTERMRWGRGCPKHHDPQLERGSGTPAGWLSPALGPRAAQLPRDLPDPPPSAWAGGSGEKARLESGRAVPAFGPISWQWDKHAAFWPAARPERGA